jgi:hypothetical protein
MFFACKAPVLNLRVRLENIHNVIDTQQTFIVMSTFIGSDSRTDGFSLLEMQGDGRS